MQFRIGRHRLHREIAAVTLILTNLLGAHDPMSSQSTTRKGKRSPKSRVRKKCDEDTARDKRAADGASESRDVDANDAGALEETAPIQQFATARELASAVASEVSLVGLAKQLLGTGEAKGASVKARMWETLVEYIYGKPTAAQAPEAVPVRIVWDMPGPARESSQE